MTPGTRAVSVAIALTLFTVGCARLFGATALRRDDPSATSFHELRVGRERRNYLLHRPSTRVGGPMPLLIVLHGSSANANVIMEETAMNAISDSIGALVAYPNGTGGIPYLRLFWNTDFCCGASSVRGPDELGMLRALVRDLSGTYDVDRSRIGVIGFSDAGDLAYLAACGASDIVTAIGVVSGRVPKSPCVPSSPVSAIVFHGTADRNVRYANTAADVAEWARRSGCAESRHVAVPDARRDDFTDCDGGGAVTLYTIEGGRHAWPGGGRSWPLAPTPSRTIPASQLIANFVIQHPRVVTPPDRASAP